MSHDANLPVEDSTCSEPSVEAISAAFALIACSDADLAPSEIDRFREVIREADACRGLDYDAIEHQFLALSKTILADFETGTEQAMATIEATRDVPQVRNRVLAAAQIALVADGRLREIEEYTLRQICRALGVDPQDY